MSDGSTQTVGEITFFFVGCSVAWTDGLSLDPEVAQENRLDPLIVQGSIRNKTAFEIIKLVAKAKETAPKVRNTMANLVLDTLAWMSQ